MSTRAPRPPAPRPASADPAPAAAAPAANGPGIVQQVLAERRELLVANERLRLELEDLRGRGRRSDPRVHVLELENRALRAELERLEDGIATVLEEMEKASS